MVDKKLKKYIDEQLAKKVSKDEIKESLLKVGWKKEEVSEAMGELTVPEHVAPAPLRTGDKLPNIFELIVEAFEILKERIWPILATYFLPVGVYLLAFFFLGIIFSIFFGMNLVSMMAKSGGGLSLPAMLPGSLIVFFTVFLAVILFCLFFQIVSSVALIKIISSDEKITVKHAYNFGWKNLFHYWWVMIIVGFVVLGGTLFFIVPGIIFSVWFIFSQFVFVTEGERGMKALLKSKEYVKGYFGPVVGRMLVWWLLMVGVMMVFMLLRTYLGSVGSLIQSLASLFVSLLSLPLLFVIFKNLRLVKGEVKPETKSGQKVIFWAFGVFGFLAIPVGIFIIIKTASLFLDNVNIPPGFKIPMEEDTLQIEENVKPSEFQYEIPSTTSTEI